MSATAEPSAAVDRVIYRPELREKVGGVSSETIRRWMKEGRLPKPDVYITQQTMGWRLSTLRAAGVGIG